MSDPTLPNETLRQQLSSFVDGELPSAEAELLVKRLARDTDLKQAMSRYVLAGEAMRLPGSVGPSRGFSARIAVAIERDVAAASVTRAQAAVNAAKRRVSQWLKPLAGMAVAAGVAAFAVIGFKGAVEPPAETARVQAPAAEAVQAGEDASYVVPAAANVSPVPIAAARLTNYVVAHSEYSSPLVRRNMLTGLLAGEDAANTAAEEQVPEPTSVP